MNQRRIVYEKLAVLLESSNGELARTMIELLYEQTIVRDDRQERTAAAAKRNGG